MTECDGPVFFPETVRYTVPAGGMFLWGDTAGRRVSPYRCFPKALEKKGCVCSPVIRFYNNMTDTNTMRLNFYKRGLQHD